MMKLPTDVLNYQFLVVDDYESMRLTLGDHLIQLGVEKVYYASSGNEALEILKQRQGTPAQVDFIITDLVMDDGSGIDLLKHVRSHSELKHLPVLMVTSKSEISLVLEAVKEGVSEYILKPWKIEDLSKKILNIHGKAKLKST